MDLRETVQSGYDDLGDAYADVRSGDGRERALAAALATDLDDDARVLVAGCGPGGPATAELTSAHDAVGLDISREQLRIVGDRRPTVDRTQGDLGQLPFAADAFDAVASYHAVCHVPREEHGAVLREFHRVLRPSGRLVVSMGTRPFEDTESDWLDADVEMGWSFHGPEQNRELITAVGFDIERVETIEDELGGAFEFFVARA